MTSPTSRSSHVPAPASPESTGAPASTPEPRPADVAKPSFVQITASVLTALTSTVALSYLGVAGTLIGAAVAAVLTALANYLYTRSLVRTRYVVTTLAPRVVRVPGQTAVLPAVGSSHRAADVDLVDDVPAEPEVPSSAKTPEALMAPARRSRRPYVITGVVTFALIIAAVTIVELGLGKPLADALRGQEGSGTTISGVRPGRSTPTPDPTPTPAPDETTEPADEPAELSPTPETPLTETPAPAPTDVPTSSPEPAPADPTEPTAPPVEPTPDPTSEPTVELPPGAQPAPETDADGTSADLTTPDRTVAEDAGASAS